MKIPARHHLLPLIALLALGGSPARATVAIEQVPLMVAEPVAPNILFILDDSGSMRWQHMPGTQAEWYNAPPDGLPYHNVLKNDIRFRAGNVNTQWYNPLITYKPWVDYKGDSWGDANPRSMRFDPSGKANISNGQPGITSSFDLADPEWPSVSLNQTSTSLTDGSVWRYRGFYVLNNGASETNNGNYVRYEFRYTKDCTQTEQQCTRYRADGTCRTYSDVCVAYTPEYWESRKTNLNSDGSNNGAPIEITNFDWSAHGGPTRTIEEEVQNFANWFSYARLRVTMAKGAASQVFSKLGTGYRVGFNTIWNRLNYPIPVTKDDGLFSLDNKQDWFTNLFNATTDQGTPLHAALNRAGTYFSNTAATGPYGPESGTSQLSCRANFSILTTDGYWNNYSGVPSALKVNFDGTDGSEITGVNGETYTYTAKLPYKDSNSGTLADVAMYYWKRDLTNLPNNVPTTVKNPAFWQHMRTYGISIGEKGKLTPDAATLADITAGTKDWGTPGDDKQENIDDLWHAAVNSHGEFLVASNPDEFSKALTETLNEITNETKSEASGGINSVRLQSDTKVFFSRYTSGRWDGDVLAYAVDPDTGLQDQSTTLWEASATLPAWSSRNIKVNVDGTLEDFEFDNLNATQQTFLSTADHVDYLRGDRSKEADKPGGTLRERGGVLPAFINSQPLYVAAPPYSKAFANYTFTGASEYAAYADDADIKSRTPMLYIAGNNGMLHAFEADTGVEKFVFLPNFSIGQKLKNYFGLDYGSNTVAGNPHQYILDGEMTVADAYVDGGWKTILVGTQGRGGNGVFALDITDPDDIKLLWENADGKLGNNLGKPIIAQVADGDWRVILGNGPNSTGDKAQLIMIGLEDGSLTAVDTGVAGNNGLSAPAVWDKDGDGIFETAYAGDLKGNIWRFSSLGGTPTKAKLFTTQTNQPVSAAPLVVLNQKTNATWVFVGTGSYLNKDDLGDTSQQSWYGLIDDGTEISSLSSLLERTIDTSNDAGAVLESGTEYEILGSSTTNRGWYIDFPRTGERMIMTPNYVLGGALFAFSFTPTTSDPCEPSGSSALWGIHPFSGASLNQGIFLSGDSPLKIDGKFASVLYAIPVVTSGSPPLSIGESGTFSIHLPTGSIKGILPAGEPRRQSWREVINQ